ncbi:zinc transporter [Tistlia consotensis]|uniref:Zinc transporter n=1 Tax=Tistlia consotensis USBA 355 TaxID=560819 RepID=A0A1Y6CI10_9PROT|nr:zinc transporter ZntB [Tistlia consotensis]SMF65660.1 zinc transporter [Tistlia consotensis USBA 355]SNS03387.1 zinc transporter [Tistlia consotensis]
MSDSSDDASTLAAAFAFDGEGHATALDWAAVLATRADAPFSAGFRWIHLQRVAGRPQPWLADASGLDPLVVEALTARETRPRCEPFGEGILLNLRGVNLNPGQDAEDMVSIRLWISERLVVSVRLRSLKAVEDTVAELEAGRGPKTPVGLVATLALRLTDRMEPTILDLGEAVDDLEDAAAGDSLPERRKVAEIRRKAITLRRYVTPQRDALARLVAQPLDWVPERVRNQLREATDRVSRYVEDLEAIRDRAGIVAEQLADRRAETMNRQSFVLTAIAAIFLPLGLLTGLLGINVGGIPGTGDSDAFWIVTALLIAIGVGLYLLFRRKDWL